MRNTTLLIFIGILLLLGAVLTILGAVQEVFNQNSSQLHRQHHQWREDFQRETDEIVHRLHHGR